jgi:hypothetical protein
MTFTESIAREAIRSMDPQTKEKYIEVMLSEFLADTPPAERVALLGKFLPVVVAALVEGMSIGERRELVRSIMERILPGEQLGATVNAKHR